MGDTTICLVVELPFGYNVDHLVQGGVEVDCVVGLADLVGGPNGLLDQDEVEPFELSVTPKGSRSGQ